MKQVNNFFLGNQIKKPAELSTSLNLRLRIPSSLIELPDLEKVLVTLCTVPCNLKFSSSANHIIQLVPGSDHKLCVTNMSSVVLNVAASIDNVGFAVEPNMLRINSDEKACVCVRYWPMKESLYRCQSRYSVLFFCTYIAKF